MNTTRRRFLRHTTLLATGLSLVPGPAPLAFAANRTSDSLDDLRLQPLKDLDGYFPFIPPASQAEWDQRAERIRRRVQVALGLWPFPTRHPLNPVVHGGLERETYRVDKVFFESLPDFFVTGNLYRPLNPAGKVPGVLFPHGHWDDARFMDQGLDATRRQIAIGAERFEEGGRSIMQSLCVSLARLGCAVFHYDMIGYADSTQLSFELAHRFARQRPEMISATPGQWGLFSPQAESNLQSILGLQTWNSIRALDFLVELPEIDPARIACTGASGGGTQTFLLAALDPRLTLAFPAVMVSTAMQGGCTCENASLLRVGTGNVEIAALFAPKPMGLTTANDWTREMSTKGFPELKQLWTLLGRPDDLALFRGEHFEHNYNAVSRVAFYGFLNRHFRLGQTEPILERDYQRLSREQLTVWGDQHRPPPSGPEFERHLLQELTADASRQLSAASNPPQASEDLVRPAAEIILGRTLEETGEVRWQQAGETLHTWGRLETGSLLNHTHHEVVPALFLHPKNPPARTVLWLSDQGRTGLLENAEPTLALRSLLAQSSLICGLDLLGQGESLRTLPDLARNRRVKNPRESAAYTFGYNHALLAQRVHDILSALQFLRARGPGDHPLTIVALDASTGPVLATALAVAGNTPHAAALHTHGFRFIQVLDLLDPRFLPGGAKYGDLPGFLSLNRLRTLWLAGEEEFIGREIARLSATRIVRPSDSAAANAEAVSRWILNPQTLPPA